MTVQDIVVKSKRKKLCSTKEKVVHFNNAAEPQERSWWDSEAQATLARAIPVQCQGHSTDVSLYVKEVKNMRLQVKELSLFMGEDSKESFRLMEMKQDSKKPMA